MNRVALVVLLLRPSVMSGTLCWLAALAVLGAATLLYAFKNPLFYSYFFGPGGISEAISESSDSWTAISDAVLAGSASYNIFIVLVATAGAFIVYTALQLFDRTVNGVGSTIENLRLTSPQRRALAEFELGKRVFVRLASFVIWLAYTVFFVKVLFPFCVVLSQVDFTTGLTFSGLGYWLLSLVLFVAGLHVHVVLLRTMLLRIRLLGGTDATVAAISSR